MSSNYERERIRSLSTFADCYRHRQENGMAFAAGVQWALDNLMMEKDILDIDVVSKWVEIRATDLLKRAKEGTL